MRINLYLDQPSGYVAHCHCGEVFPRGTPETALIAVTRHLTLCPHVPYILGRDNPEAQV